MSSTPESPVTVFCGKGGVGKTALSLAFALWHADQGRRVLVITSHPLPELALSVSLAGLKESHPATAANLYVIHIDPRQVLEEIVRRNLGASLLADTVISSRIYQSLIEVAPGMKEIAFMSTVRDLAFGGSGFGAPPGLDCIIWDAPATGHFLRTLEVARDFDSYLSGPLAVLGKSLAGFLSEPSNLRVIPVTTLEEMAVDEAIELCQKLTRDLKIPPAALVCNMSSPLLAASDEEWEQMRDQFRQEVSGDALFVLERNAIERALFNKLRQASDIPTHIFQRRPEGHSDVPFLLGLGKEMGGLV